MLTQRHALRINRFFGAGMILFIIIAISASHVAAQSFFVSLTGNDTWSGTRAEPNSQGTDGPFLTLERARNAVRNKIVVNGLPAGGISVSIRKGTYLSSGTLTLGKEDSGKPGAPVVWQAYKGEIVRLVAGLTINNFVPVTDPQMRGRLSTGARQAVQVADVGALGITSFPDIDSGKIWHDYGNGLDGLHMQLYQNDKVMTAARFPNQGWATIRSVPMDCYPYYVKTGKFTSTDPNGTYVHCARIGYNDPRPASWAWDKNLLMYGYWVFDWSADYQRIGKIDSEAKEIEMVRPYSFYGYKEGQRYYYLNVFEELDTAGEWYVDRNARKLYFWPPETITDGNVIFCTNHARIWSLDSTSDIIIRGMVLEGAGSAAVAITGGARNLIDSCTVRNMPGDWAIEIRGGTLNGCSNSTMYNLTGSAISLVGGDRTTLMRGNNYAIGNHIYDFAMGNKASAISMSGVGNRVAHNRIHNGPQTAIGWSGNEHLIEYNEIFDMVLETNDAGAVYAGRNPTFQGNIIRYNYFHDIGKLIGHGSAAIYLDDGVSGTLVYGNVFVNAGIPGKAKFGAVFFHGGRYNRVENNIFVHCPTAYSDAVWSQDRWQSYWTDPYYGTVLTEVDLNSPPWSQRYPWLKDVLTDNRPNAVSCNVAYRCGAFIDPGDSPSLSNNIVTARDPGFVDTAAKNFALKAGSWVYDSMPCFAKLPFDSMGMLPPPATAAVAPQKPIRAAHALMGIRMIQGGISLDLRLDNNREKVVVSLYNAAGKRLVAEVAHRQCIGKQQVVLDTRALASGLYVLNVKADGWTETRNLLLHR